MSTKPLPKRRPGRPTKAEAAEHARLRDEQEQERIASIEARADAELDEILHQPVKQLKRVIPCDEGTLRVIFALAKIAATQDEIATALGVPRTTFQDFMERHPEARDAWESGLGHAKMSLRRKQFKLAEKLAPMAIFLGKNMLGQKDINETINTNISQNAAEMTEDKLLEIIESGKRARQDKTADKKQVH